MVRVRSRWSRKLSAGRHRCRPRNKAHARRLRDPQIVPTDTVGAARVSRLIKTWFSAVRRLLHKLRKAPQMERTIYNLGHHLVVFLDVLGQRDKFEGLRKPTSTHRVDEKKYPDRVRAGALGVGPLLCALRYVHAAALNSSPARFTFHGLRKFIVEI